jgi:hypothetical protein
MAIDLGQSQKTFSKERRTWNFQVASPVGQEPIIEVFRELKEVCVEDGTVRSLPDSTPIRLVPADLPALAPHLEVPPELASLISNEEDAVRILTIMPLLIAMCCDAADRSRMPAI